MSQIELLRPRVSGYYGPFLDQDIQKMNTHKRLRSLADLAEEIEGEGIDPVEVMADKFMIDKVARACISVPCRDGRFILVEPADESEDYHLYYEGGEPPTADDIRFTSHVILIAYAHWLA